MPVFIDQTDRSVFLASTPKRIISLVPSQTELLFDLGLNDEVVGITRFCVHPAEWFSTKTKVGGTKQVKMDIIHQLQPDLIIANKEENIKEQIEELEKHFPVWISDVKNLEDAYEMIDHVGSMTGKQDMALQMILRIKENFTQLPIPKDRDKQSNPQHRTCYLIWQNPYMTIGGDTFIHSMLEIGGFRNIFGEYKRYPEIIINDLVLANCQLLLLPSEPFPFKQKHIEELQPQLPGVKILLVDGEMFSWYGSRLLKAPAYFRKLQDELK